MKIVITEDEEGEYQMADLLMYFSRAIREVEKGGKLPVYRMVIHWEDEDEDEK